MISRGLLWSGLIVLAMVAASIYGWTMLPDGAQFPVHWRIDGTADRYASKIETLGVLPALAAFLILIFALGPFIIPRRENLESSRALYLTGWIGGIAILALAHAMILYTAITGETPSLRAVFVVNGLFLVMLGKYMAKSKPNWIAGIKTPWTLDSDYSWSLTNRFAGRCFVLIGIATMLGALVFDLEKTLTALLVGLSACVVISVLISYVAWRRDPERQGGPLR